VRTVLPHSFVDAPAFEPRGNVVSTAAPSCLRCVMPAFVPGWDAILQMLSPSFRAFVGACLVSCFFGPPCREPPLRSAAVAEPPACACPRAREVVHAIARSCTRTRVHASWGSKAGSLASFLAPVTSLSCLLRRCGLRHSSCLRARAGRGKGEAFWGPSYALAADAAACSRTSPPTASILFLSAAVSTDPSSAMA
jgi:hypothetical protein